MNLHISGVAKAIFRHVAQIEERNKAGDQSLVYVESDASSGSKVSWTW